MKKPLLYLLLVIIIALCDVAQIFAQEKVVPKSEGKSYNELKKEGLLGNYTREQLVELQRTNPGRPEQVYLPPPEYRNINPVIGTQSAITATPDTSICLGASVTLYANSYSATVSTLSMDDIWSDVVSMGFSFTFYGNTYTQCIIGSNGEIGFNLANANTYNTWPIGNAEPTNLVPDLENTIQVPWQDLYLPSGGTVTYSTVGISPNRIFVAEFCNVGMFSCGTTNGTFTGQVQLYEGTNVIETHITSKVLCSTWNGGYAIHGTQNSTGTSASLARNYPLNWTTTNEAKRWTWNGSSYTISNITYAPIGISTSTITWFLNGSPVGTGSPVTVTPASTGVNNYIAQVVTSWCGGTITYSDTATVTVTSPVATPTVAASPAVICSNNTSTLTGSCGGNCQWYTASTGGTPIGTGGTYTTPTLSSTSTYYVQSVSGSCSSSRVGVMVTVNPSPTVNSSVTTSYCPTGNQTVNTTYTSSSYSDVTVCASNPSGYVSNNQTCTDPNNANCAGHFQKDSLTAPYALMGATLTAASIQSVYVSLDTIGGNNSRGCGDDNRLWLRSPGGTLFLLAAQKSSNSATTNHYKPTFTVAGTLGVLPNAAGSYNSVGYLPDQSSLASAPWIGQAPGATWAGNSNENYSHSAGQWMVYTNDQVSGGGCNPNGNYAKITEFCITFRTYPSPTYSWSTAPSSSSGCNSYLSSTSIANPFFMTPSNSNYNCTYNLVMTDATGCTATATINLNCNSLPIALLSYSGKNTALGNKLEWITASEINNNRFTIERSMDGSNFTDFKTVLSQAENGNSSHQLYYSVTDADIKPGNYYYRLRQTDLDGNNKEIGTVAIAVKTDGEIFNIKPNPTAGIAEVTYECQTDEMAFLNLYDDKGMLLISKEIVCQKGQNSMPLDLSGKQEGVYLITITTGDNVYKARLVLSRSR